MKIGVNTSNVNSDITKAGNGHDLGNRYQDPDGGEWIFVKASAAFTLGDAVVIKATGHGAPLSDSNAITPGRVGFAQVAFTIDYYGWVKCYGAVTMRGGAACNAKVALYTTATAGVLDDAVPTSASHYNVLGVVASQSASGAGETMTGFANYPIVDLKTVSA